MASYGSGELMWAAGFIEGEGCFSYDTSPTITVAQDTKNTEPLYRLQEMFGGSIGPARTCLQWRMYGMSAVELMYLLRPHMSKKRQHQIDKVLARYLQNSLKEDAA